ncbi:hypothetical protein NGM10_13250 [Halorussus salilacus]|uniref:hypothetical protein n=1 Tax=Halorussus salilacus TaxID=2953750 RepID=UPI00209EBB08|nr:hypothetical protein [Halorussus salilacus]USZ67688.1 hypothetical protein NGM10_13250 [Halorussus salilacus]
MKRTVVLMLLIVISSTAVVPHSVAADDEYPSPCDEAPLLDATGEYEGAIDTPEDVDTFRVQVDRGDYLHFNVRYAEGSVDPEVAVYGIEVTRKNITSTDSRTYRGDTYLEPDPGVEGTGELWAEESGAVCFKMHEDAPSDATVPYQWRFALDKNSPTAPEFTPASDELQTRAESLESEVEEQNETITELESQLSERQDRIAELESELEEAESNEESGGDVTINVEVTPAGDQQNFVTGGKAQLSVQSDDVDPSEVDIEYGSATYGVGADGQAEVALADAGTQNLNVVYGDTSESVSFDVQASDEETDGESAGQDDGDSDEQSSGGVPGFGFVTVLGAVALLVAVGLRRD